MNICLIRTPVLIDKEGFAIDPTPPLGLAYIASALKNHGHEITVIDAVGEAPKSYHPVNFKLNLKNDNFKSDRLYINGLNYDEVIQRIPHDSQVIGLSLMFSNNWLSDRHLIDEIGRKFPLATIIAGGESISAKPNLWLDQAPFLKVCVIGEGEETIVELIRELEGENNLANVDGIVFRSNLDKNYIQTNKRSRIKALDEIPLPAWELFPINNYLNFKMQYTVTSQNVLPILATRGCPYSCTFCSSPQMWGTKYSMRSPQSVADEIERLVCDFGVNEVDFYDLTAIVKKDWIISFTNELIKRKLNIRWNLPAGTRSEAIDEEVARQLYLSGCKDITYAPESGSERMLKLIKKKVKLDRLLHSMNASNKNHLRIYVNMILGLPGEKHKDIWKTIWFLVKCSWNGAYEVGLAMFHPYPGSELFEKLVKENRIDLSKDDFFYDTITLNPVNKTEFLYNEFVSARWYQFYNILAYLIFFGSNYLFRPIRFFRMLNNVLKREYKSRFERTISKIIYRERFNQIK